MSDPRRLALMRAPLPIGQVRVSDIMPHLILIDLDTPALRRSSICVGSLCLRECTVGLA